MSLLLSSLLLGHIAIASLTGPFALFWSRGQTWVVDAGEGTLYRAPTLYSAGAGAIFEYKLKTNSERRDQPGHPFGSIYRWVSFERHLLGSSQVDTLTNHYDSAALQGDFHDEHHILQFSGDWVTLGRWIEQRYLGQHRRASSAYSIDLTGGRAISPPPSRAELLTWIKQRIPTLIPPCLTESDLAVRWELPGQRPVYWLLLQPETDQQNCQSPLSALRLTPPPSYPKGVDLSWDGDIVNHKGSLLLSGIVDALIHPNGQYALFLEGPPRSNEERLLYQGIDQLVEPKQRRFLVLWRQDSTPTTLTFPNELNIQRLDGARWIEDDNALFQILSTHFQSVEAPECFQSLVLEERKPPRKVQRPELKAHLCRIQTETRPWRGVKDLSAQMKAFRHQGTLFIYLWVNDMERSKNDGLKIWFGNPEAPNTLTFKKGGVFGTNKLRDQILFKWNEEPRGYSATIELPIELVKDHFSAVVMDSDPNEGQALTKLWIAGQPNGTNDIPVLTAIQRR